MEDFLKSVGIEEQGKMYDNERYIIRTTDLSILQKWVWKLGECSETTEIQESSRVDASTIKIQFETENFKIELYGNVDEDDYKLTVTQNKDD